MILKKNQTTQQLANLLNFEASALLVIIHNFKFKKKVAAKNKKRESSNHDLQFLFARNNSYSWLFGPFTFYALSIHLKSYSIGDYCLPFNTIDHRLEYELIKMVNGGQKRDERVIMVRMRGSDRKLVKVKLTLQTRKQNHQIDELIFPQIDHD